MKKRILVFILAFCMIATLIPTEIFAVPSTSNAAAHYFYNQLDPYAKIFYNGMVEMYTSGMFQTGTEALDLVEENPEIETLVAAHMSGSANLLSEFGAARDAFCADYPDVFYVDFSALSVRVTQESSGKYHLYMGPGRYETYYTEGFTSKPQVEEAIREYEVEISKAVAESAKYSDVSEKITAVHDYIAKHVTYRDETKVNPADMGYVRTSYGAMVKHEGVCEAYTRAFKSAMDRLGIPCVMVYGVYRHDGNIKEFHIWNEVMIDGLWYGVDVTMDDPINKKTQMTSDGLDGFESHEYLLVGSEIMNVHHIEMGVFSESGFEFGYPALGGSFEDITDENNPLKVRYRSEKYDSEITESGTYYVSYLGMNTTEMKQNGYYLILRNKVYDVNDGWQETDWYYSTPELYDTQGDIQDIGHETRFAMPQVEYVEFGVTTIPYPEIKVDVLPDLYFHGDITLILARSGLLHNEDGTYRAAPASLHGIPSYNHDHLEPGKTYHLTAYYNDILVTPEVYEEWCKTERFDDPAYHDAIRSATSKDFSLSVRVEDTFINRVDTSEKYQTPIKNVSISFTETETLIELDYTASSLWIDDNIAYVFNISGLVGAYSGKTPDNFGWVAAAPCAVCAYRSRGIDYNCFAKPVLVDDSDLSMEGWVDSEGNPWEGTPWDEAYKSRLMLVVEETGPRDSHEMEEEVEGEGEDVLSALTYNINLTLCKLQWANLQDGMSVRIQLGFPEGFGPEDEGVTFKAYHFNKDPETGEIISINEIPCYITQYGLLIEVSSFSPFAIVAVADDGSEPEEKAVVLTSRQGGKVTSKDAENGTVILKKGESTTVTVTPDEGYETDMVLASETEKAIFSHEKTEYSFELSFDDIIGETSVISAEFIAKTVAEKEVGEQVIPEAAAPESFTLNLGSVSAAEGEPFEVSVKNANSAYTYYWYKIDGNGAGHDSLVGVGSTLRIDEIDSTYSGVYYVIAVATAGATSASTRSTDTFVLNVGASTHTHTFNGDPVPFGTDGHRRSCVCGEYGPVEPHTYNALGICTVCDFENKDAHTHTFGACTPTDKNMHTQRCTVVFRDGTQCTETVSAPHVFEDGKCILCGYVGQAVTPPITGCTHNFAGWSASPDWHYRQCLICGAVMGSSPHIFVGGLCQVCGYPAPVVSDSYGDDLYVSDDGDDELIVVDVATEAGVGEGD